MMGDLFLVVAVSSSSEVKGKKPVMNPCLPNGVLR
jgi:hypothetical protein